MTQVRTLVGCSGCNRGFPVSSLSPLGGDGSQFLCAACWSHRAGLLAAQLAEAKSEVAKLKEAIARADGAQKT